MSNTRFSWVNASVLTSTPIAAVVLATWYVFSQGFVWTDLVPFVAMYFLTGLAITAGYHRYYAHRTYHCHPIVQAFVLIFGAAALQNSALVWVSDHRSHHRHVDGEADPYNIQRGFLWAHIGWIFFEDLPGTRDHSNVPDLEKSRLVRLQARFYVPLAVVVGLGVPFLIGLAFDRPWGGMLWGGLVRTVFVHHCTFLINSAAHFFGKRPYATEISARDNGWLAFLSYGEGYHNFHHAFPGDYRNGIAWYHWDPTKWTIRGLSLAHLAWGLRRTPASAIARRRQMPSANRLELAHELGDRRPRVAIAGLDSFGHSDEGGGDRASLAQGDLAQLGRHLADLRAEAQEVRPLDPQDRRHDGGVAGELVASG